eukprot:5565001-Pleurochrysis_carterae.AAC.3
MIFGTRATVRASYVVKSVAECDKLRGFGAKNRHVGATKMNQVCMDAVLLASSHALWAAPKSSFSHALKQANRY